MARYRRLTYTERLQIERYAAAGMSKAEIGRRLGRAHSTIVYEMRKGAYERRNSDLTTRFAYSADIGQQSADYQATAKGRPLKLGFRHEYARLLADLIKDGMSPDAVSGYLKRQGRFTVSTPTIYRYIDKGYIPGITNKDLLRKGARKRSYHHLRKARSAPYGLSIERRPQIINSRSTFGHWEIDCVTGRAKGADQSLLVLTERLTRYELIYKLHRKTAAEVFSLVSDLVLTKQIHSLTCDNGPEFSQLWQLHIPVYYCHPYTSCERGSNENANALIRRFYPKKTDFSALTQRDCDALSMRLNSMIRKSLNYHSPGEIFSCFSVE